MTADAVDRTEPLDFSDGHDAYLAQLGARVKRLRAQRGLSRKLLAERAQISPRYIAQLESGRANISIVLMRQLCQAMGVGLARLLDDGDGAGDDWLERMTRRLSALPADQRPRVERALDAVGGLAWDGAGKAGRIALVGLRGAGKSTLGALLARDLDCPFVEMADRIQAHTGLTIGEVFELYGTSGYRRLERDCLDQVIAGHDRVVMAVGGGIVSEPATYDRLKSAFRTVWLKAAPEEHMQRVLRQGDQRPMAGDRAAMDELRTILASREALYAQAEHSLDTTGQTVEACLERLRAALK